MYLPVSPLSVRPIPDPLNETPRAAWARVSAFSRLPGESFCSEELEDAAQRESPSSPRGGESSPRGTV